MRTTTVLVALAALLAGRSASAQYFEARNAGMGGTGIASSHYLAASWANPALLTRFTETDDFGILLPSAGVFVNDRTGLIDDIQSFVDEFDRIEAMPAASVTQADLDGLADSLAGLSGRELYGTLGGGFALAFPSRGFAWSLHLNVTSDTTAFAVIDPADVAAIRGALGNPTLPTLASEARALGVGLLELGASLAMRTGSDDCALSVGLTGKYQSVETFNYATRVDQFEDGNFTEDQYRLTDSGANVDVGASLALGSTWTFGAMARNLVERRYDMITVLGQGAAYEVKPELGLGAAWQSGMWTLSGDVDVLARERFADQIGALGQIGFSDDVQFVRFGAECNLFDWLQLRGGYAKDLEGYLEEMYTAGLGISPFATFHLDLAGSYVNENSYGAVLQMALTF